MDGTMSIDPEKTKIIEDYPVPTSTKQVKHTGSSIIIDGSARISVK
jgi:hypothetical protein